MMDLNYYLSISEDLTEIKNPTLFQKTINDEGAIEYSYGEQKIETEIIAEKYFKSNINGSGIIPPTIRSFYVDNCQTIILFERRPFLANVSFKAGTSDEELTLLDWYNFQIEIPWTVYFSVWGNNPENVSSNEWLKTAYVWARPEPIYSEEDYLFQLPIPNVFLDGEICVGPAPQNKKLSLSDKMNYVFENLWATPSNSDVGTQNHKYPLDWKVKESITNIKNSLDTDLSFNSLQTLNLLEYWSSLNQEQVLQSDWQISINNSYSIHSHLNSTYSKDEIKISHLLSYIDEYSQKQKQTILSNKNPFAQLIKGLF